ncbi:helix-turn-helix transcriptional regulator [Alteromonas macleodii]|uniref:helix-turn-helix transcriptional regulator n=1 Tax=Alteromonas macleodii TaxID=28108 RepID=UPI0009B86C2B|nr:AlpA family phage regulatory protein [Alteromonas macleodii]
MVLRTQQLLEYIGLSRTTIWRLEKSGQFPKRVRLGQNSVGWLKGDVDTWLESRKEGEL